MEVWIRVSSPCLELQIWLHIRGVLITVQTPNSCPISNVSLAIMLAGVGGSSLIDPTLVREEEEKGELWVEHQKTVS